MSQYLPVEEIIGTLIEPSFGESVFMGRINDLDVTEDKTYLVDDRSQIFILDSDFNLLTTKNVSGPGPGEVQRGVAIRAVNNGFLVFDSESMKFVKYDNSLNMSGELKVSNLFPHLGFSFVVEGSKIYTADNSTGALISLFDMDLEGPSGVDDSVPAEEMETDLTFFEGSKRSQARDNLYHIHRHGENLMLVNRWNPVILVLSRRNGIYETSHRYNYEDVDYFRQIIDSNREFHEREENASSWKTLVRDSAIYNNSLLLLVATEESGNDYSSHILVLDLESELIHPKQIYQLVLESGETPWLRNMAVDKDGNLLASSNDYDGLLHFDLNLGE